MRGKKLSIKEKEDRAVERIVKRLVTAEIEYGIILTRRACHRYYMRRGNELALKRKIKDAEEELQSMKKRAK